jgi:hypothetical protein
MKTLMAIQITTTKIVHMAVYLKELMPTISQQGTPRYRNASCGTTGQI